MVALPQKGEKFPPPSNKPPGDSLVSKLLFMLRTVADLQVASVLLHLKPWLAAVSGSVLEIGCGAQPYRHFLPKECSYTALDWEKSEEYFDYHLPDTIYYQGGMFPFPDNKFVHLFHTSVLEHIYEDSYFLRECRRMLKSGGAMFFAVPFQARYHYIPHDYRRYTPAALEIMLKEAGFADIKIRPLGTDITVAAYKNLSIVYRLLRTGFLRRILGIILSPLAVLCLLVGHVSMLFRIGSPDDCLGYAVTAYAGPVSESSGGAV